MIADRRTLAYVVIAIILGAALALAVALSNGSEAAPGGAAGTEGQAGLAAQADVLGSDQGAGGVAVLDPARTEVVLDQFQAKDPFIPLPTGTPTPTPTPTPTETAKPTAYEAQITVNGSESVVVEGDKVPSGSPAFKVSKITATDVTFTVIDGKLKNGDTSVTVNVGESVKATLESGKSYTLAVLSIRTESTGPSGHSISVLSITTSNGSAMCTLEVDGKTYPDLKVGDTVQTPAGEIAIIAINVSAQTVTIMLGDQTIVLHAGQVVVK